MNGFSMESPPSTNEELPPALVFVSRSSGFRRLLCFKLTFRVLWRTRILRPPTMAAWRTYLGVARCAPSSVAAPSKGDVTELGAGICDTCGTARGVKQGETMVASGGDMLAGISDHRPGRNQAGIILQQRYLDGEQKLTKNGT